MLTAVRFWPQRWLAVRTMPQDLIGCSNQRKLKALIPRVVVFVIRRRRREGSILLSFLLFYGPMVGKYALICAMEIQKIQMVIHILRICFICGTNVSDSQSWISLQVVDREQCVECALWFTNKRVQIQQILSMLKLFSFESLLLWTGFSSGGSLRKEPRAQSPTVKYYSWY